MPKETVVPIRVVTEERLNFSRSEHTDWDFKVPVGTPPDALLRPEYWKHVAASNKHVKPRDRIHAECDDRSWMATYVVRDIGPYHIKLAVIKPDSDGVCRFDDPDGPAAEKGAYRVEWISRGDGNLWGVRRTSDGEWIKRGLENKAVAEVWLDEYLKEIAA